MKYMARLDVTNPIRRPVRALGLVLWGAGIVVDSWWMGGSGMAIYLAAGVVWDALAGRRPGA